MIARMRVTPMPYEPIVTVTSLPFSSSTFRPSVSAKKRPSWKTWPISMPRASSTGPEPSGAGSPARTLATSTKPSAVKSRPAMSVWTCFSSMFAPVTHAVPSTTRGSSR